MGAGVGTGGALGRRTAGGRVGVDGLHHASLAVHERVARRKPQLQTSGPWVAHARLGRAAHRFSQRPHSASRLTHAPSNNSKPELHAVQSPLLSHAAHSWLVLDLQQRCPAHMSERHDCDW